MSIQLSKHIQKKERGFTLLEVLVAMLLLSIVITAGMTAISSGLRTTFAARDQVTAFYLAQEAVEIVKNNRDTNSLNPDLDSDWMEGFRECVGTTCAVDAVSGEIDPCSGNACVLKRDDNGEGVYGTFGDETEFSRTVSVEQIESDEIVVEVQVVWNGGDLTIQEHVFNWRR